MYMHMLKSSVPIYQYHLRAPNLQLDLRLTGGTLTGRLGRVVGKVGRRHTPPRTSFVNEVQ